MIRDAKSSLGGAPSKGTESQQTDFASITGTATAKDGVLANQDLSAKSPLLRVSGKKGWVTSLARADSSARDRHVHRA
jgi:AsmA protein